ncbi:MAG: prepilin-type N-terminal cleavage/methylation domain-containing protein [Candidatus Omnitrophota bacterium]|nr:prepilin-type N-terminal cleavage/methylation domain-containing protein [Candidatus Omnitrophota bacterium]
MSLEFGAGGRERGFTLIEVITAITLMAIIMIPIALFAMEYVRSIAYNDSLSMATNLACREMAIVNTLSYTDPTLANGYDLTTQSYAGYGYNLRRTVNYLPGTSSTVKRVRARIYPAGSTEQVTEFVTYVMNIPAGAGSAGGASGNESDSFLAREGVLARDQLTRVTMRNTRTTGNITVTKVILTSSVNKTLRSITMEGETRFTGSETLTANIPKTIDLQKNFIMNSNLTYSRTANFYFSQRDNRYSLTIAFVFYDGTQSAPYTWSR